MNAVPTVSQWLRLIDGFAPFSTAEPGDNVGLLIGAPCGPAGKVMLALDVTEAVAEEAAMRGSELLIAHHPILYRPASALLFDDPKLRPALRLLKSGVALITAHTNLDKAAGGTSDTLAELLGIVETDRNDFLRVGTLPAMALAALLARTRDALGGTPRLFGDPSARVARVAACAGAGMDEASAARAMGAEVMITGDVRHHDALEAGLPIIDAGHWETERPVIARLARHLQNEANQLDYNFNMEISRCDASPVRMTAQDDGGDRFGHG